MILKKILIPPDSAGIRLNVFLRSWLPDLYESDIRKLFSSRDVKLDGRPAIPGAVLEPGQELKVFLPESKPANTLRIVYEDDDVLLVNKPSGISVEPDTVGTLSLTEICAAYASECGFMPPVPCHRLDIRTSGLCLFAKNNNACAILSEAFRSRRIDKYYICLVRGMMKPPAAVCKAFLLKDANRALVSIYDHPVPGSRPILTGYETLEAGPVSRLKVHLITGRTHQIRAHLAALGHPILGDDLYGDRAFNHSSKTRALKLCAFSLTVHTEGLLPDIDGRTFSITPPF